MGAPSRKPVGGDMLIAFGKPKGGGDEGGGYGDERDVDGPNDETDDEDKGGRVPAAFESAHDDWKEDPSAENMYAMIKACQ